MEATFDMSVWRAVDGMAMSGDYSGGGDPDAMMDMSIDVAGQQMQMRLVDQSFYMSARDEHVPGQALGPGRPR